VQAALEAVPGVRDIVVTFERREALVRYDFTVATLEQLQAAVSATGGYEAVLKYGPVKSDGALSRLTGRKEYSLENAEGVFNHSGFYLFSAERSRHNSLQQMTAGISGEPPTVPEGALVVFASLWTDDEDYLEIDWLRDPTLTVNEAIILHPEAWIPLAQHFEKSGGRSVVGLVVFTSPGEDIQSWEFHLESVSGSITYTTGTVVSHPGSGK